MNEHFGPWRRLASGFYGFRWWSNLNVNVTAGPLHLKSFIKSFCEDPTYSGSNNDQNMSTYDDQFTPLSAQLERMGRDAAKPDLRRAPSLLGSIGAKYLLEWTATVLHTKEATDLTLDYVLTTLIGVYNAKKASN